MANVLTNDRFTENELLGLLIAEEGTIEDDLGVKFHGDSGTVHVV
jgi:hypothetical protein